MIRSLEVSKSAGGARRFVVLSGGCASGKGRLHGSRLWWFVVLAGGWRRRPGGASDVLNW